MARLRGRTTNPDPGVVSSRAAFGGLLALVLGIGLVLRLVGLGSRPMHHDEANQAVKFGELLEHGNYRYDPNDHHGPTLYYLTLPVAWVRGETTLASLDERTVRLVPVLFGTGLILLVGTSATGLGRKAAGIAALLIAVSPAFTYYSRFYIQETLFVFFAIAFVIALGRYVIGGRVTTAVTTGVAAGLAYATKETSVIVLSAGLAAAVIAARWPGGSDSKPTAGIDGVRLAHVAGAIGAALLVAFTFYSSWFINPSGLLESIRAFGMYVDRGVGTGPHTEPWTYYLGLLAYSKSGGLFWSEAVVLALGLVGIASAARRAGFWPRYWACYAVIATAAFSLVPYKTPWNLLPFYAGIVLMAGYGAATLIDRGSSQVVRGIAASLLAAAALHLGLESWRANGRYASDPRNPYVYAQTSPDFLRLVERVHDVAALHPDGRQTLVVVIADAYEQWPLPWYLRGMARVGYWPEPADGVPPPHTPLVIASQENQAALDAALGDRYVSEHYGLRPGVILTMFIERTLWERFLASRR